jgi:leucyl aminopeptidase
LQVVANACYAVTGNVPAVHVAVTTEGALATDADTVAVGVFEGETVELAPAQALLDAGEAKPAFKHLAVTHSDGRRVIVAGLGARDQFDPERARIAAAVMGQRARELGARHLCWELPRGGDADRAAGLVEGTVLGGYRFTRYQRPPEDPALEQLTISAPAGPDVTGAAHRASVLAGAQNRARDWATGPPTTSPPRLWPVGAPGHRGRRR